MEEGLPGVPANLPKAGVVDGAAAVLPNDKVPGVVVPVPNPVAGAGVLDGAGAPKPNVVDVDAVLPAAGALLVVVVEKLKPPVGAGALLVALKLKDPAAGAGVVLLLLVVPKLVFVVEAPKLKGAGALFVAGAPKLGAGAGLPPNPPVLGKAMRRRKSRRYASSH